MSKTELAFEATWRGMNQNIEVNLPIILFQENAIYIAYCPALEISGYGNSDSEAKESFETVLGEFLLYVTNKNTLIPVLKELGWKVKSNRPLIPPSLDQLTAENQNVKNIFDNYNYQIIDKSISLSA